MRQKDKPPIMQILHNTPEFKPSEIAVAEEVIDEYLRRGASSGYNVIVAEVGPSIAGYICFGQTPLTKSTWDIYWLVTSPDFRQKGIGKTLLKAAERRIKRAGGKLIIVETSSKPEYEKARTLYRFQGYQLICQIADFYEAGDDKLVFAKRLSQ